MNRKSVFILCTVIFSLYQNSCIGQIFTYTDSVYRFDFIPARDIIFQDDFGSYTKNSFPANWNNKNTNCTAYINIDDGIPVFAYVSGNGVFATPKIPTPPQSNVYVTFECDFKLTDTDRGNLQVCFFSDNNEPEVCYDIDYYWLYERWEKDGKMISGHDVDYMTPNHVGFERSHFDPKVWHHFAVSFTKTGRKNYMDHYRMCCGSADTIGDSKKVIKHQLMPKNFSIGGQASYVFKNVRFAESPFVPVAKKEPTNFNNILTHKKFVTHAIYFDVNKADIKPESISFINELFTWLNQNKGVKLEIDGHTDSDGSAASNIKLSQDRAEEVKKQLVLLGVNGTRLTAKGYGATMPIQPNTTPDGKAENRRVEFIRQ